MYIFSPFSCVTCTFLNTTSYQLIQIESLPSTDQEQTGHLNEIVSLLSFSDK